MTVVKPVSDILDTRAEVKKAALDLKRSNKELAKEIKQKEKLMGKAAKDLNFELAAQLRDEIQEMRNCLIFKG